MSYLAYSHLSRRVVDVTHIRVQLCGMFTQGGERRKKRRRGRTSWLVNKLGLSRSDYPMERRGVVDADALDDDLEPAREAALARRAFVQRVFVRSVFSRDGAEPVGAARRALRSSAGAARGAAHARRGRVSDRARGDERRVPRD